MHFLCLHGMGTNSRIFEAQTAAIRYALGSSQHTFEFIDGAVTANAAPQIMSVMSSSSDKDEEFLQYFDSHSTESCRKALLDLEAYVTEEGPFDGVMAFSQGAGLAATLLVHQRQQSPRRAQLEPIFRCAIFFCGGVPEDPRGCLNNMDGGRRLLSYEDDGEIIEVPSVHIWGGNDQLYPTFGPVLSKLCSSSGRENYVHSGGHEIPSAKDPEAVKAVTKLIKRTIERAG